MSSHSPTALAVVKWCVGGGIDVEGAAVLVGTATEVVVVVSTTGTVVVSTTGTVVVEALAADPVVVGADVTDGATVPIRTMATRSSVTTGSGELQADEVANRNATSSTGT